MFPSTGSPTCYLQRGNSGRGGFRDQYAYARDRDGMSKRERVADTIITISGIILMYGLVAAVGVGITSAFLGVGPQNLVGAVVAIYVFHTYSS
jgi:hypothetical protein